MSSFLFSQEIFVKNVYCPFFLNLYYYRSYLGKMSNKWTVPLGGGFGRMFNIGKQPINTRLRAYYNAVRPDGAPDWQIQFTWQFIFPKS
jgi:hypothetical protein